MHHRFVYLGLWLGLVVVIIDSVLLMFGVISTLIAALIAGTALGIGSLGLRALYVVARRANNSTGHERFINQTATVLEDLAPMGRVMYQGENWAARLDTPFATQHIAIGETVRVIGVENLCLITTPSIDHLVRVAQDQYL